MVGTARRAPLPTYAPNRQAAQLMRRLAFLRTPRHASFKDNSMPTPTHLSRPSRRSVLIGGAALGALSLSPWRARADQWPARPVKLMVPFAAGGTTDLLARIVANKISEEFGQQ